MKTSEEIVRDLTIQDAINLLEENKQLKECRRFEAAKAAMCAIITNEKGYIDLYFDDNGYMSTEDVSSEAIKHADSLLAELDRVKDE